MIFQYNDIIPQQAAYVKSVYVLPSLSPSLTNADINSISLFCVNAVSSGSPSRILIVLRISLGITTRPRSSMRRTIPVAFIFTSVKKNIVGIVCAEFDRIFILFCKYETA